MIFYFKGRRLLVILKLPQHFLSRASFRARARGKEGNAVIVFF